MAPRISPPMNPPAVNGINSPTYFSLVIKSFLSLATPALQVGVRIEKHRKMDALREGESCGLKLNRLLWYDHKA
jgi:hypothetical protein